MSDQPTTLMDVIGDNRGKPNGHIEYSDEIKERAKQLLPTFSDLHSALESGSRHVSAMLAEVPQTLDPKDIINWWNSDRDRIPAEAGHLMEVSRFITDCQLEASRSLGPL